MKCFVGKQTSRLNIFQDELNKTQIGKQTKDIKTNKTIIMTTRWTWKRWKQETILNIMPKRVEQLRKCWWSWSFSFFCFIYVKPGLRPHRFPSSTRASGNSRPHRPSLRPHPPRSPACLPRRRRAGPVPPHLLLLPSSCAPTPWPPLQRRRR